MQPVTPAASQGQDDDSVSRTRYRCIHTADAHEHLHHVPPLICCELHGVEAHGGRTDTRISAVLADTAIEALPCRRPVLAAEALLQQALQCPLQPLSQSVAKGVEHVDGKELPALHKL